MLKYLLKTGIKLTEQNNAEQTAIDKAIEFGRLETGKYLVQVGSNLDEGHLVSASYNGHLSVV